LAIGRVERDPFDAGEELLPEQPGDGWLELAFGRLLAGSCLLCHRSPFLLLMFERGALSPG
jgi:hypothetical protein